MHHKNNNNGAHREPSELRDPYIAGLSGDQRERPKDRSEAITAVMDEMSGTATSRRAQLYNHLPH